MPVEVDWANTLGWALVCNAVVQEDSRHFIRYTVSVLVTRCITSCHLVFVGCPRLVRGKM